MGGIMVNAITVTAALNCPRCDRRWKSVAYTVTGFAHEVAACAPAFDLGWRVYAARRNQRAYCPDCVPTVPMTLVYGARAHPGDPAAVACPDGVRCQHHCKPAACRRVAWTEPLSGVYPNDEWPVDVKAGRYGGRNG